MGWFSRKPKPVPIQVNVGGTQMAAVHQTLIPQAQRHKLRVQHPEGAAPSVASVNLVRDAAGRLAEYALLHLWQQSDYHAKFANPDDTVPAEFDDFLPCCTVCCNACHGLRALLEAGELDQLVSPWARGHDYWDLVYDRVDRQWLAYMWRDDDCTNKRLHGVIDEDDQR